MAYEYTRQSNLADGACYLCKVIPEFDEDGIKKIKRLEKREVFCSISSVYWTEYYKAYDSGIKTKWRLLVFEGDYQGETLVEFKDELFNVYREFRTGDTVELYVKEDDGKWQTDVS